MCCKQVSDSVFKDFKGYHYCLMGIVLFFELTKLRLFEQFQENCVSSLKISSLVSKWT